MTIVDGIVMFVCWFIIVPMTFVIAAKVDAKRAKQQQQQKEI